MKFLHLGDLHLGRSLLDFDLIPDQSYILDRFFQLALEHQADAVIIAGDVYDRPVPSEAAVNLFDSFLCRLAEQGIDTFIISGNHDSDDRLNFGSSLFRSSRIYIASKYRGELFHHVLQDGYGDIHVYLLPFVKASQVRHYLPDEDIVSCDGAVRALIRHAGIDPGERNIIAAHQFVTGVSGSHPETGGSEGMAVLQVGLVEEIGYSCFESFDYAALGHLHKGQKVGRDGVRYSGSPLKYSLSEAGSSKSVPLITLGAKGDVSVELLPLKPLRDLRHLRGTRAQLLDPSHITDPDDFIYVTLTDEDFLQDAMGVFRQYYPNTVRIDYDNSHTREIVMTETGELSERRSFEELISDFYSRIYGEEISEEELEMMKQAAGEAGVIHETD